MGRKQGLYPNCWISGPDPVDHRLFIDCQRARAQANYRGEVWLITEKQYTELWRKDDQYLRKGRKVNSLCLVRKDVALPWQLDNVMIIDRLQHFRAAGGQKNQKSHTNA